MLLIRPTATWKNIKTDKKKKNKQFVYSVNMLTLVKVELLVGRAVTESFDVHQVAVHVRVVQSAERHVCREGVCVCVSSSRLNLIGQKSLPVISHLLSSVS